LIGKFYCIFHSLIGDGSDGFGAIQKGKSIVYWYGRLKEKLQQYGSIRQLRADIFNNPLDLEDDVFETFIKRLQVVDFYFFSNWLVGSLAKKRQTFKLTDYDKSLYEITYSKLPLNCRTIIEQNMNNITTVLRQNTTVEPQEAKKVLESFNVGKADYYAQVLWS